MDEFVEITSTWIAPKKYVEVITVEEGIPLIEIFPDGMLCRRMGDDILDVRNGTKEDFNDYVAELD